MRLNYCLIINFHLILNFLKMGNIVALDMGIVVLRVSIFDKDNKLFPFRI
jgi:hypothetical protein